VRPSGCTGRPLWFERARAVTGIVVNDSIILMDYINTLRR
jgi:hypothetical protein